MSPKFKVTIFKKTKNSHYPKHIIVERKSPNSDFWHPYNDTVHLYFNKGVLAKFVHVQDAPKGKKIWDSWLERYVDLEPKHQIANEFVMKDGKIIHLKEQTRSHFYLFSYNEPNTWYITFCNDQTSPGYFDYFHVPMDLNGNWRVPNDFVKYQNNKAAEIKEVYTQQTKNICPFSTKKDIER